MSFTHSHFTLGAVLVSQSANKSVTGVTFIMFELIPKKKSYKIQNICLCFRDIFFGCSFRVRKLKNYWVWKKAYRGKYYLFHMKQLTLTLQPSHEHKTIYNWKSDDMDSFYYFSQISFVFYKSVEKIVWIFQLANATWCELMFVKF